MKRLFLVLTSIFSVAFASQDVDINSAHHLKRKMESADRDRFSLGDAWSGAQSAFQSVANGLSGGLDMVGSAASSSMNYVMSPIRDSYNINNPYRHVPSKVRLGNSLSREEQLFLNFRSDKIRHGLSKNFGIDLGEGKKLRVALCGSGGGYRAMIYTLGAFMGAKNVGLLDSSTYVAGLSGSTWTIGAWLSQGIELSRLKEVLQAQVESKPSGRKMIPFVSDYSEVEKILNNTISRLVFKQPLSIVAIWGALIANGVLHDMGVQRQLVNLSSQRATVAYGNYPMPVYTAVEPLDHLDPDNPEYRWFEFTPYEVGSAGMGAFVPSWAFGRKYKSGESRGFKISGERQFEPEMPFGYQLGVFGSAFEVDLHEFMSNMGDLMKDKPLACKALEMIARSTGGDDRLMPAEVRNPVYKMDDHDLSNQKYITLIDAGLCFNVPLPPLLRDEREVDVIFVMDSSASVEGACELVKAEKFAREHGLKFPKIDYTDIDKKTMSVFADEDSSVPVIVYMPRINDTSHPVIQADDVLKDFDPDTCTAEAFCSTFNFGYSSEQFEQLCRLGQRNVEVNKDQIADVLKRVLARKA